MVDPERRKKLDEIRMKRKLLQEQLHQNEQRKNQSAKTVEEEARDALRQAVKMAGNIRSDELINKTQDNIMKMIQSKRVQELATTKFNEEFPAYKPEVYDEGTQWSNLKKDDDDEDSEIDEKEQINEKPKVPLVVKKNKQVANEENDNENKEYKVAPEEEAEKYRESHKEEMKEFLKLKIRTMERAVNEDDIYNMFLNDDYEYPNTLPDSNNLLHPILEFYDKKTSENRTISALEWSIKYPELLLSCYTKRTDDFKYNQQNGLIQIWNLANREEAEFKFTNQAEITSAIFHPYNPRLIIGGTETGIVMVWDTRGKQTPIYKTPLGVGSGNTSKSHTSDITCLGVIGSINSSHIVSLSNGIICLWSLSNMSSPIKKIELRSPDSKDKELNELNVLSMSMQQNDTNNIFIGCDDNNIYQISLNDDSKSIINFYKSHEGPVYSIDFHPNDFPHIFATSSADWTTRIWNKQNVDEPIISLEQSNNYVYSCKWSPVHPSILSMGDGNGYLDIMDLNKDIETPKVHCKISDSAINKICWTEDGKRITSGDSNGKIKLFGVDKQLYIYNNEDTKKFENVIGQKK